MKDANEEEAASKEDDVEDNPTVGDTEDNGVECALEEGDDKMDEEADDVDIGQDLSGTRTLDE